MYTVLDVALIVGNNISDLEFAYSKIYFSKAVADIFYVLTKTFDWIKHTVFFQKPEFTESKMKC